MAGDIKEIYTEAKSSGFDTKVLRTIIYLRKKGREERVDKEALLGLYMDRLDTF